MNIFKKLFSPKEVRAAIGVLNELECTYDCVAFRIVREQVERLIFKNPKVFVDVIKKGTPPRQWVLGTVSNFAGDHVESGEYHVHRGLLDPLGPGNDFLKIYDATADELVRMGVLEAEFAERQKAGVRDNIRDVG